ncbi:SDR family NAD(P)-dependent oxidoreductase [Phragmitibacter flavus]|uniref:SDR family NAD(P)-dependent oxidoreductase n=1 Tax=Phragmitibacter flavus TaxID=2576071 RepID=A0A5R8KDW4_9BACT|nr:SDR family NAD(P)-dependent oxidoreductase [Phragmitibacter flavus]TLD70496.1 SDR family NAD(P)-dependent oxidoreductase [Phragmitibacter flavus]
MSEESSSPNADQPFVRGFSFKHCVALITGASSGLGAEFARQLAPQADTLLLAARTKETMETLAAELSQEHPHLKLVICPCDLSTDAGRETFWQNVAQLPTKPNLLINNAGLGDYGLFADASGDRIRRQIDLNITALTLLARSFLDHISPTPQRPAAILNVSSLAGAVPVPDLAVYAATKSYVTSLTESLAIELASRHIQVAAVCPGPTPTNFGNNARRPGEKDIDRGGQDVLKIPPHRVVEAALQTLRDGRPIVYPGKRVTLAATVFRIMPRSLMRFILAARFQRGQSK